MSTQITWHNRVGRFLIVILLVLPLGAFSPLADPVRASQPQSLVQQDEVPIDNSLTGNPIMWINQEPLQQEPWMVGAADGPDVSPPGEIVQKVEEPPLEIPLEIVQVPNQEGIPDLSLSENQGSPEKLPTSDQTPPLQFEPIPLDPGLDATLSGGSLPQPNASQTESLTTLTGNLDDFNRANGLLGDQWIDKVSGISIENQYAHSILGASDHALTVHNGIGVNQAMARIETGGAGVFQYAGLALNYADSQQFIFIKVQDNNTDGFFDTAGCYMGNNDIGYPFGLGFFSLSSSFPAATLKVEVNSARSVRIDLTDLAGGGGNQSYVCDGAPIAQGSQFGIVSYGGSRIDNLTIEALDPAPITFFNEQDGPLGSNWWVRAGDIYISDYKSLSRSIDPSLATYNSVGGNSIEADVSLKPGGGSQYAGLVLNFDEGVNDLYLKVQDTDGNGNFEHGACYLGNNGASFGLGYFSLISPFTIAHMKVSVGDDRVVSIEFSHINGGSGTQAYSCAGAPIAEGYGVGIASWRGGRVDNFQVTQDFQDNFNRPDGSLGSSWTERDGSFAVVSQKAKGIGLNILATYNGSGSYMVDADVALSTTGNPQYSALILDYGAGITNLFLKVQDNYGDGTFNTAACYTGNNNYAAPFGLGFFNLSAVFTTAHMEVSVDNDRVVTMTFSNIDGGSGMQVYVCAGAPAAEGSMIGIGSDKGGLIDNVRVNRIFGYDPFNRSNGALGPSWQKITGTMALVDQKVLGTAGGSNLTIFSNVTGNQIEGDISANPSGELSFSAFILNYGTGNTNLFIKFQNGGGDTMFESIGCYIGNNINGFGPGYFSMTAPISTAHVKIAVNSARTVTILLTRIDGGTGTQVYTCAGAPPTEGSVVGIASLNGGLIDSVMAGDYVPMLEVYLPVITR